MTEPIMCGVRWEPGQTLLGYTWCGLRISASVRDEIHHWAPDVVPDISCEDCQIAITRAAIHQDSGVLYKTVRRSFIHGGRR